MAAGQRMSVNSPLSVLIVDDDIFIGRAVGCILEEARGVRVHVARSADEAVPLAASCAPRMVIADLRMPGMSLLEMCRRLRSLTHLRQMSIYLLTGCLPEEQLLQQLQPFLQGVLAKPPDPGEIIRALDQVISGLALPSEGLSPNGCL